MNIEGFSLNESKPTAPIFTVDNQQRKVKTG